MWASPPSLVNFNLLNISHRLNLQIPIRPGMDVTNREVSDREILLKVSTYLRLASPPLPDTTLENLNFVDKCVQLASRHTCDGERNALERKLDLGPVKKLPLT